MVILMSLYRDVPNIEAQVPEIPRFAVSSAVTLVYGPPAPLTPQEAEALIRRVSAELGYNRPDYAVAIAKCESGLRPWAKSRTGDHGLWQINKRAHPDISAKQAYDPEWSTYWAIRALKRGSRAWTCQRIIERKNCVTTVVQAGYKLPKSRNGWAGTIPTNAKSINEGQLAVAVTTEGTHGHVLVVKRVDGQYISVIEGNYPNGIGRVVPTTVIKGFVI